jgi:hypothetical protein
LRLAIEKAGDGGVIIILSCTVIMTSMIVIADQSINIQNWFSTRRITRSSLIRSEVEISPNHHGSGIFIANRTAQHTVVRGNIFCAACG